jgi:hypothetical protein
MMRGLASGQTRKAKAPEEKSRYGTPLRCSVNAPLSTPHNSRSPECFNCFPLNHHYRLLFTAFVNDFVLTHVNASHKPYIVSGRKIRSVTGKKEKSASTKTGMS